MAVYENKQILIKDNELPVVNGRRINAIYACMETAYRTDQILHDCYTDKPDYYHLVTDDSDYKNGKWINVPDLNVKNLPAELAALFGKVEINGKTKLVTHLWFRTRCSGNGSFIDQSISFSSFCYYRLKRGTWGEDSVFQGEPFEEKILKVLGGKFKVEELPEWYNVEYPHTPLRREGGLLYPDYKLSGWRRSYRMPFVSNNYPKTDNIRVFYEPWNAHLYLERVPNVEVGDKNLVVVKFSYESNESNKFCCITTWAETKKEDPEGLVRFEILRIEKNRGIQVAAMLNGKVQFKEWRNSEFYRVVNISKID